MTKYKFSLRDKREFSFDSEENATKEAQSAAKQLNERIVVRVEQGGNWPEVATVYPSGEVRKPVDVSTFARNLETRKLRR